MSGGPADDYILDSASIETGQRSSTKRVCVVPEPEEKSPNASQTRPSQIEWQDEADIYLDEDIDLPYPGYLFFIFMWFSLYLSLEFSFVEPSLGCLKQAQPPRYFIEICQ